MGQGASDQRLTGREAAMMRRQALAEGGKASAGRAMTASRQRPAPQAAAPVAQAAPASPTTSATAALPKVDPAQAAIGAGRLRAIQRREKQIQGRQAVATTRPAPKPQSEYAGLSGREAAMLARARVTGASYAKPDIESAPAASAEKSSCGCGCKGERAAASSSAVTARAVKPSTTRTPAVSRGRMLSMARRAATANRGKAGMESMNGRSGSAATASMLRGAGASSREIARKVREARCAHGKVCDTSTRPTGRVRTPSRRSSTGGPTKVDVSETAHGQVVTGTKVGRSTQTTGDEIGACRPVTGTEYLGADVFQEFCGFAPEPATQFSVSSTPKGLPVSGDQVGRSRKVTGDETGAGRALTGTPYTEASPEPVKVPPKVGQTATFAGGAVTGTLVGRSTRVTGDEPGACRRVTGDEYVGSEQYQDICGVKAVPETHGGQKVGQDATWGAQRVTGTRTGRSSAVTGDEPGTCALVTGTPYAGPGEVQAYCPPPVVQATAARARTVRQSAGGLPMTGIQPGVGGVMTGDEAGACRDITGTQYTGEDQLAAACDSSSSAEAIPGSPDFPQPLAGGNWSAFSVQSPARAAQSTQVTGSVTGTSYDAEGGRITGPFNMGRGMVTGTENFRAKPKAAPAAPLRPTSVMPPVAPPAAPIAEPVEIPSAPAETASDTPRSRVTGEGMDGGARITGDDWGRNGRVTGTEGLSSAGRNPTRRGGGGMGAFAGARTFQEAQDREQPISRVTGSSGNTERGALITVSGGARG